MADHSITATNAPAAGPTSGEALVADREQFWGRFTRMVFYAVVGIVVLLVLMTIFLV